MKKSLLTLMILLLMPFISQCAGIKDIKVVDGDAGSKLIMTVDDPPKYSAFKGNDYFRIKINDPKYEVPTQELRSEFFKKIDIKKDYNGVNVIINYKYLTSSKISYYKDTNNLVVSFSKISKFPLKDLATPEVTNVIAKNLRDFIKISIELTGPAEFSVRPSGSSIMLELLNVNSAVKSRRLSISDYTIRKLALDQTGSSVLLSVSMTYPAYFKVYRTEAPYRVILEIDKKSKSTLAKKDIVPGVTYIKVVKGLKPGAAYANVLIVDPASVEVTPYIPERKEEEQNMFQALISTFSPPKGDHARFFRTRVSEMVKERKSIAGINGTYFGEIGEPLGILMIGGELISYSVYDRTALIVDKSNKCFIDNVSLTGEISIEGNLLEITGINEKRETGDVIIFTPRYGKQTDDDSPGLNLSVENGEVKYIGRGRTWIPDDGYVISLDPTYYEKLNSTVRVGSMVGMSIKASTFSSFSMDDVKHIIGGGPRLLKSGQIYISKNMEKFKSDIAMSRAARTAVGITKDGKIMLVTVDRNKVKYYPEPSNSSTGMTLEELAMLMQELGAVDAMNLDGGGSTTFVLEGKLTNNPSNGEEIGVSNAILIEQRTSKEGKRQGF